MKSFLKKRKFPSPYGVTVIKSINSFLICFAPRMFPSPYGVTVIKSKVNAESLLEFDDVSVPLRGNGN